MLQILRLTTS